MIDKAQERENASHISLANAPTHNAPTHNANTKEVNSLSSHRLLNTGQSLMKTDRNTMLPTLSDCQRGFSFPPSLPPSLHHSLYLPRSLPSGLSFRVRLIGENQSKLLSFQRWARSQFNRDSLGHWNGGDEGGNQTLVSLPISRGSLPARQPRSTQSHRSRRMG